MRCGSASQQLIVLLENYDLADCHVPIKEVVLKEKSQN